MANIKEIPVPDIGDFDEVEVIEILVSVGDSIEAEDSLISLESDKATMEIPAPEAGIVKEIKVAIGDKVALGSVILLLESSGTAASTEKTEAPAEKTSAPDPAAAKAVAPAAPAKTKDEIISNRDIDTKIY